MLKIDKVIEKSKYSKYYRKLLNIGLNRLVPFNKPHGFKVIEISDHHLKTFVPYKKSNFNHIRGIHACALATLSEFTTGFLLLTKLDPKKYRLIMQSINMVYHYQAKMDCIGNFSISEEWLKDLIIEPLKTSEKVTVDCKIKTHDKEGNHISTGVVTWQIKSWQHVKTRL